MLLRLTLLLLLPLTTLAQRYPIQATVTLTPPYSPYLTDLTAPGAQRLALYLHVTDPTLSDYTCKLRLTIEGVGITLRTRPSFQPIAIPLQGGVPQIFYGEDLIDYFNPNNLDFAGLSRSAFAQTHRLPEGVYRFSIEVLDYNRGTVVSNKATATAWIILNDPPLLNLPRTNTKLSVFDPTNIPFTWTPRHTASPNAAFSTEYVFRLFELPPTQLSAGSSQQLLASANQAVLSQLPLYETTLTQSQLVYGPGEPALIPGRWYAWQVQAIDTEGRDLFKNRGKSEVFVFQFGDALNMPGNVRKETANHQVISIRWDVPTQGDMPEQYRVLYKPTLSDHWYEDITRERWHNIGHLKPNATYDIKVRSEKGKQYSEYTTSIQAKTEDESTKFQCGGEVNIQPIDLKATPLPHLLPGDTIRFADFYILVREAKGSNGQFEGKGSMWVKMFNGASIRVKFSGKINMLYELDGEYESISNTGNWASNLIDDMEKIGEDRRKEEAKIAAAAILPVTITLAGEIAGVIINSDGDIVVTKTDGSTETIDHPVDEKTKEKKTVVLVDEKQNQYTISSEGIITKGAPGSGTTGTDNALFVQKELIKEILNYFKVEINLWLENNGKGPLDEELLNRILALPDCLPQDEDKLKIVLEKVNEYLEHAEVLLDIIKNDYSNKNRIEELTTKIKENEPPYTSELSEAEREELRSMVCPHLKDISQGNINCDDYILTKDEFRNDKTETTIKILNALCLADKLTNGLIERGIDIGVTIYEGIMNIEIEYAGNGAGTRAEYKDNVVSIYEEGIEYQDIAISTFMHEYNAHYMEDKLDIIPDTEQETIVEKEPNPFLGTSNDPYNGAEYIEVIVVLMPVSVIKEEINGYRLEKNLHYENYTSLEPRDIEFIEEYLEDLLKVLEKRK